MGINFLHINQSIITALFSTFLRIFANTNCQNTKPFFFWGGGGGGWGRGLQKNEHMYLLHIQYFLKCFLDVKVYLLAYIHFH